MPKKYWIIGGGIVLLIIILLVVIFSGGKSAPKSGPVTLAWWKTFETTDNVQDLIADYQKIHKNVTINYVKKDITTYESEFLNAMAAGTGPDIVSIHNAWLPKHIDKLSAMPASLMTLRQYKDTFIDAASTDFTQDGKIYALPMASDDLALYYNKDILGSAGISQPPATWDELVLDVQKITKQSVPGNFIQSGIAMGTASNVNRAVDILSLLMLQNGTQFYSPDLNTATFDQSVTQNGQSYNPGTAALEYYTQFAQPSKKTYTWNSKSDNNIDAFTQGKVGMILGYSYLIPVIQSKAPNLNWDIAAAPQINLTDVKVNFANYWGEAVSKFSKNQAVAWDFLNFVTQKQNLEKYYAKHKQASSRKDILSLQLSDTEIGVFAENALTAKSVYKKDSNQFESIFANMIDDVVLHNFSAQEAISNAVQQVNLSLRK